MSEPQVVYQSDNETRVLITAPMHVSSHGFAAGVATAQKAVRELPNDATIEDVDRVLETLLARANQHLAFNNSIMAHRLNFKPGECTMRCRIDKANEQLILTLRKTG